MPRVQVKAAAAAEPAEEVQTQPAPTKRRAKNRATKRPQQRAAAAARSGIAMEKPAPAPQRNVAPMSLSRSVDAAAIFQAQDRPRDLPTTGGAFLEPALVEPMLDRPGFADLADELAFMNEECHVIVATTPDPNADPVPGFWVNGRSQYFPRGERVKCRRCYVEKLARTITTTYRQQHYKDANGNDAIRNIPMSALTYPFQVVHDPNPNGAAWLANVLRQA